VINAVNRVETLLRKKRYAAAKREISRAKSFAARAKTTFLKDVKKYVQAVGKHSSNANKLQIKKGFFGKFHATPPSIMKMPKRIREIQLAYNKVKNIANVNVKKPNGPSVFKTQSGLEREWVPSRV